MENAYSKPPHPPSCTATRSFKVDSSTWGFSPICASCCTHQGRANEPALCFHIPTLIHWGVRMISSSAAVLKALENGVGIRACPRSILGANWFEADGAASRPNAWLAKASPRRIICGVISLFISDSFLVERNTVRSNNKQAQWRNTQHSKVDCSQQSQEVWTGNQTK